VTHSANTAAAPADEARIALLEAQVILSRLPFFAMLCERYDLTMGELFAEVDGDAAACLLKLNNQTELWLEGRAQLAYRAKFLRSLPEE